MVLAGVKGNAHYNDFNETYCLHYPTEQLFGITGYVPLSNGLTVEGFNKVKDAIAESLGVAIIAKHEREHSRIRIATVKKIPSFPFVPCKAGPQRLLTGYDIFGAPYILDLAKSSPHLLVAGASGTGKTYIFYMIMANLLYNFNSDKQNEGYFEVVLLQIMKTELSAFKDCEPCKNHLKNGELISKLEDVSRKLDELEDLVRRRGNILRNTNVRTYNELNKDNPDVDYVFPVYVCLDELAFFMPAPKEQGSSAKLKKNCIHRMVKLGQAGRSCAVHIIALAQRLTAANVDPNMKSNFARLTAFQNSIIDSQCAIDCTDATKLLDREVILKSSGIKEMLYIPTIKEDASDLAQYAKGMSIPKAMDKKTLEQKMKELGNINDYMNKLGGNFETNFIGAMDTDEKFQSDEEAFRKLTGVLTTPLKSKVGQNSNTKQPSTHQNTDTDNILFRFIERYGFITQRLGVACTGKSSYPKRRFPILSKPKNKGELPKLACEMLSKVVGDKSNKNENIYYEPDRPISNRPQFYHDYIVMNFYAHLYENGFTIEMFETNKVIKVPNGSSIRPDANIIAKKDNKKYHIFLEVDESHATGENKIADYECLRMNDFSLIIATGDKGRKIPQSYKFKVFKENFEYGLGGLDRLQQ